MANKFFAAIKARYFSQAESVAIDIGVVGDSVSRFAIDASGKISWSDGSDPSDVSLQRVSASEVAITGNLSVSNLTINDLYEMPSTDGDSGDVIITNGQGVLDWSPALRDVAVMQWVGL